MNMEIINFKEYACFVTEIYKFFRSQLLNNLCMLIAVMRFPYFLFDYVMRS